MDKYDGKTRSLFTKNELKLIEDSAAETIETFNLSSLRKKIDSARKYYDKWRDLSRARQRQTGSEDTALRQKQKSAVFKDVLRLFENQAKKLEKEHLNELGRKRKKILAASNLKVKKFSSPMEPVKKQGRKSGKKIVSKQLTGQRKTIRAYISSRNKRSQLKRDSN
ncbi:MAG TPA: hypothetical protein PK573_15140 [Spirochaetota bacterium]|nr:hypothetical protein [Spirochaetota bacterium]HRZ28904.1 hypothetical protein [Spirochaetota bacterium]